MAEQISSLLSGGPLAGLMLRARWLVAGSAIGFVGPQATGMGRTGQGPAEEMGQVLDRAARSGAAQIGIVANPPDATAAIVDRVDGRLAGDKGLDATKIEVRPGADGAIELHGVVANQQAKERAVEVARETRGISEVVDSLAVAPRKRFLSAPNEPEAADPGLSPAPKAKSARAIQASRTAASARKAAE